MPRTLERRRLAYDVVRERNQVNLAQANGTNATLDALIHERPIWEVGAWMWVYNDVQPVRRGVSAEKNLAR